eukprot:m.10510 g.10510  ORF g.10510 m.10510 type:complete len:180 (-) comp2753_c0_seq1:206-745(-)
MGKTPQQRRKLKTNQGKRSGMTRKAQKQARPKQRETRAVTTNITNPVVKAAWDTTKTRRKNFEDIGLVQDPNETVAAKTIPGATSKRSQQVEREPTEVVEKLEAMAKAAQGSQPVVAAPGEVKFVDDMVAKHGDDYQAMARDLKLNVYQHTARQIEHKVKRVQKTMALAAKYGVDTEAV